MKKRICAFFLAFCLLLTLFGDLRSLAAQAECPYCDYTLAEDGTVVHSDYCNAEYAYDGSGDVGKYVRLSDFSAEYYIMVSGDPETDDGGFFYYEEFVEGTVMRINDWYWDPGTAALWYQVEIYVGGIVEEAQEYWPETPWVLQNYTENWVEEENALSFVSVCDICGGVECRQTHLYCLACEKFGCELTHQFCGYCNDYDCGIDHLGQNRPAEAPVIPEDPTLTEGADVSVADEYGNAVTDSFILSAGMKSSLSAWTDLEGELSYQWQICVEDQWIDILGQKEQGILVSPAMFLSVAEDGRADIRCEVTNGEEVLTSAEITVSVADAPEMAAFARGSSVSAQADGDGATDLQTVYVVVQYVYADGRTASSTDFAEIIPGNAYSHPYPLPTIPGYRATLNTHSYGDRVTLDGNTLNMNFAAGELTEQYTIFTVTYVPDFVSYTVIHYRQNVDNDNYTEHERETVSTTHKTGEVIDDAHKSYDGFYNLLYETPAAAADGSTVVEVYYDRYYYLMKFELGENGYGVDPIYARYGDAIEIGTPTRAGYTFLGWKLNGTGETIAADDMPKTMPAENRTYVAQWQMASSATVNVVIWGENADDEEYSYVKTVEIDAVPGETISWDTLKYDCGYTAHSHSAECGYKCGYEEHQHSAGCYSCGNEEHTHERDCYTASGGTLASTASNVNSPTKYNGDIYYTSSWGGRQYYLKIGDTYYSISFEWWNGESIDSFTCNISCGKSEHTHGSGCSVSCGKAEHSHGTACYACGKTEHTHTSGCEADLDDGMDTDLWEFYESEEVTVKPDGSTVLNVKYKRKEYTVNFYSNSSLKDSSEYVNLRITAKWGANILNKWPKYNSSSSWYVGGKQNTWQNSIQIMPVGGAKFWGPKTGSSQYKAYYYVEALPGDADAFEHNDVMYIEHHTDISSSSGNVTDEERYGIEGFDYKEGTANGTSYNNAKFYYTRHKYAIEFYNPTTLLKKVEGIYYESNLGEYDFTPTPAYAPDVYEPGSVEFAGWYLNPECTGEQFILADHTMPSAPENGATALVLYAKWEPVEYTVNYYLTEESLERGENIPAEMTRRVNEAVAAGATRPADDPYTDVFSEDIVKHGGYIPIPPDPKVSEGYEEIHPRTGYDFLGWFYIKEDGDEAAFDPANMPVNQNLDLYAKWSSNKLCKYNVYFALDANGDGVADLGTDGKPIYVADPISGSAIAGRTYTFTAKGGDNLYDPEGDVNYREGYFPTAGSHSITINIQDEEGTGANSFTFLYRPRAAVPYTVQYVNKATGEKLFADKVVKDNKNVVVTENFLYKQGFMPDAYQKTLVVTDDGDASNDVIIFYYTEDTEHALYVVNYYIQTLDDQLDHAGWTTYTDLQYTGEIGTSYSANAIDIDGFTLSKTYTDQYNVEDQKNGATDEDLPSETIYELTADGKLTGTLTEKGMELNFYYTRNLYPYEFRYVLMGTTTKLAESKFDKASYDTIVTEGAKEIVMDLDGDGINEDYRLYDPTETSKDIHIIKDGQPLASNDVVSEGQATVNIATFEYVRCTQTMTIEKIVVDNSPELDPDPNQVFYFSLLIHAKNGYHMGEYEYQKSDNTTDTLKPEVMAPNTIRFALKAGEKIEIKGLPTAEYTLTELDVPTGYYAIYTPQQTNKLTVDAPLEVTVTNTYDPAVLEITKTVDVVEDNDNIPEVEEFKFTVTVPDGVTGSYDYTVEGVKHTETVTDGKLTLTLKNGQTARFENVPVGSYTVEEEDYSARGYKSSFVVNGEQKGEGHSVVVQVARGETQTVQCINHFPVGHLQIKKTVTKEFFGTAWDDDTFTFTVERTTEGRPLINGNQYDVYEGESKVDTAAVTDGKLQVEIKFTAEDAAKLDEQSEQGAPAVRTITIRNLPAGTYEVTESADADYVQTPASRVVYGLEIPAEETKASFINELIRPKGDLSLSKELVAADGYTGELPQDTEFSFTFEATLLPPPNGKYEVKYKDKNGNDVPSMPTTVEMKDGKFTLKIQDGQTVTIKNLPIDTYRITEATVPRMANAFYHNGSADPAEIDKDSAGNLCTQIPVPAGRTAAVRCVNTYPVDNADLTIIHENAEPGQIFVYEVKNTTNEIITVTVTAGNDGYGSTTIVDLPFGSYTVTQKNDWSWRYREEASDDVKTVVHSSGNTTVTFAQTWIDYWLGGCSYLFKNIFGGG